jgi:hypothetical protein
LVVAVAYFAAVLVASGVADSMIEVARNWFAVAIAVAVVVVATMVAIVAAQGVVATVVAIVVVDIVDMSLVVAA